MLGRVTGRVVAPVKNLHLEGEKLLLVQPVGLDGAVAKGAPVVATDRAQAGPGDLVLVNNEGGGARLLYRNDKTPVRSIVVAVVDDLDVVRPAEPAPLSTPKAPPAGGGKPASGGEPKRNRKG